MVVINMLQTLIYQVFNAGGSNVTDTFTYTESIGGVATTKTLTIYVIPSQGLTARNDTGNINVGGTLTVSNSSNATDVDTATFSSLNSKSITSQSGQSTGVVFNDDGTKMYISDSSNGRIYEYPLSTAFDVSTAGSSSSFIHNVSNANSVSFNNDGTKLFILDLSNVRSYDLTTGFDVTSQSGSATTYSLSSQETSMRGLTFNNDGTKMFTVGTNNDKVYEYTLSSAFDLSSTVTYIDSLNVQSQDSYPTEIKFNHDGTKMYIAGNGQDINEYTLSTAFDISSTVTHKGSYSVSSSDVIAYGFSFNNDGTKLFTTGANHDRVNEHSLTTPFSLVDVSGEHSGDVINTSSTDNYDTDPDSDTLTVTAIRTGSS